MFAGLLSLAGCSTTNTIDTTRKAVEQGDAQAQFNLGVMYAEGGKLIVKKILPKTAKDFESFYNKEITGRFCAFHLRMKTHGDINLDNCHPYEVLNQQEHGIDLWLMHNGILSTGNASDETKSDTWHYIKN